jgi:glycosyltransferase involved in cell wall biosynthesis
MPAWPPVKTGRRLHLAKKLMPPLVSILIPAYNAQEWIGDTIKSALAQTWARKEIVIVDDGSSDQTPAIARRFESAEVKVVVQKNQGASAARNQAFSLCQGDYIQWLDADDLLAPDKIKKQMNALGGSSTRRTLLVSAWGIFGCRTGKAVFSPTALWRNLPPREWLLLSLSRGLYMQTTAWLVSRELTKAAGPWDTRLSLDDDGEYFFRVIMASDLVKFVEEARAYYRRLGFGVLSNLERTDKKWESQYLSILLRIGHLRSLEDSTEVRAACLKHLQDWASFFYPERIDLFRKMQQLAACLGNTLGSQKSSAGARRGRRKPSCLRSAGRWSGLGTRRFIRSRNA